MGILVNCTLFHFINKSNTEKSRYFSDSLRLNIKTKPP